MGKRELVERGVLYHRKSRSGFSVVSVDFGPFNSVGQTTLCLPQWVGLSLEILAP